jgi:putative transposase
VPQSLAKNLIHLVFSTRNREPLLAETVRDGYARMPREFCATSVRPRLRPTHWRDHIHLLFSLSKNQALSQAVMEVERSSSKWLKNTGAEFANFHWQAGYGAFSIGQSGVAQTTAYIADQSKHHRRKSFEEELLALLKLYELEFDERYPWE